MRSAERPEEIYQELKSLDKGAEILFNDRKQWLEYVGETSVVNKTDSFQGGCVGPRGGLYCLLVFPLSFIDRNGNSKFSHTGPTTRVYRKQGDQWEMDDVIQQLKIKEK